MKRQRQRLIDASKAGREGRRWHAFYQGYHSYRTNGTVNPHKPGSPEHQSWQAGWQYAQSEVRDRIEAVPPLCRFGPGGDFVSDVAEGDL